MNNTIRLRPWVRWFFPRLFLALGIYCTGYTALNGVLSASLAAEFDGIRKRGEPAAPLELTCAVVDPEQDAGPYFRAACALMEGLSDSADATFGRFSLEVDRIEDGDPNHDLRGWYDDVNEVRDMHDVDAWLRNNEGLQTLLDEVVRRSECRSTVAFGEDGPFTLLPHLMPATRLSEFTLASSSVAASEGELDRAVAQHGVTYALARCVYADRYSMISALVGARIEGDGAKHLQLLLETPGLGVAQLDTIEASLEGLPELGGVHRESLIGERSGLGIFMFQAMLEGRRVSHWGDVPAASGPLRLLLLADFAYYLESMNEGIEVAWEDDFTATDLRDMPRYAVFTGLMTPALRRFRSRLKRVELMREVMRCALSLERDRVLQGSYPSTVEPRFAALGIDYTRAGAGYCLNAELAESEQEDPVVFRVER